MDRAPEPPQRCLTCEGTIGYTCVDCGRTTPSLARGERIPGVTPLSELIILFLAVGVVMAGLIWVVTRPDNATGCAAEARRMADDVMESSRFTGEGVGSPDDLVDALCG